MVYALVLSAVLRGADAAPADPTTPVAFPSAPAAGPADPWAVVNTTAATNLEQVIWTGKEFVAAGGNVVVNSPDGLNWTAHGVGNGKMSLLSVAYNGKEYVVVGANGAIASSPDLNFWQSHETGAVRKFSLVVWTGNKFFALGDVGAKAFSPDGVTWTLGPSSGNVYYTHGVWSGTQLVLGSAKNLFISSDAENVSLAKGNVGAMHDVAWGRNLFVAVGDTKNGVMVSADGASWAAQNPGLKNILYGVTWTGQQFVAVGEAGTIISSPDGTVWKAAASGTRETLTSVAGNGTVSVAVGKNGAILSTNAKLLQNYHSASLSSLPPAPGQRFGPASGGGPLDHWTVTDDTDTRPFMQIAWLNNQFVATSWDRVRNSGDGFSWNTHTLTGRSLNSIATNGSLFVVVSDVGEISTSPDLEKWTKRTSSTTLRLFSVLWTGTQFEALGDNGIIVTSADGIKWTQ